MPFWGRSPGEQSIKIGPTHNSRLLIAIIISPLFAPIITFGLLLIFGLQFSWAFVSGIISAGFSYFGTLVFGWPLYHIFRNRNLTSIWLGPVVGFLIGAFMWVGFAVLFPLSLGQGLLGVKLSLFDGRMLFGVLWPGGLLGAVTGAIFWLIARPDRSHSDQGG